MACFDVEARQVDPRSVHTMHVAPEAWWRDRLLRGWAMMLDAVKQARVIANRARMRVGRTVQAAAVYRTAYGGQQAVAVPLILKQQGSSNPIVEDQTNTFANEYVAELAIETDPRPIAYLALTGGAIDDASIAAAVQLEVIAYRLSGLVPNRWQLTLRRLR